MPLKTSNDPCQFGLFATPLEVMIEADNEVRVIAAYVDSLDLNDLGFKSAQRNGASSYGAAVLLKIYLYGYLNRIRSSRQLAKACRCNIELMWLTGNLQPKYHTIADFRKNHIKALKQLFKDFVLLCKSWHLIGAEVFAVDGTKVRAQNAMKRNFSEKKIKRHLDYIDQQIEKVMVEFETNDSLTSSSQSTDTTKLLEQLQSRKQQYLDLQQQLSDSEETQISTTDPDARALPIKRSIVEMSYNVQTVIDERHSLIVGTEVTNEGDINALGDLVVDTCNELGLYHEDRVKVLADKGYHNAAEMAYCHDNNVETYVAVREQSGSKTSTITLRKEDFYYDAQEDMYICPNNQVLSTNGSLYNKPNARGKTAYRFKRYTIYYGICEGCPLRDQCMSPGRLRHRQGRYIERNEHEGAITVNANNLKKNPKLYKRRQSIVEHPFGTIKRSWGYHYTLLRTLPKVNAEWSLIHLCYNLRRVISIIGVKSLIEAFKSGKTPQNRSNKWFLRTWRTMVDQVEGAICRKLWSEVLLNINQHNEVKLAGRVFAQTAVRRN